MTLLDITWAIASTIVDAAPYCLPDKVTTALDTAKFWTMIIAVAAAVIGLVMIGIGAAIGHERGDGHQLLKKLMGWIIGAAIIAGASGIASAFITVPTDCVPF